MKIWLYNHLVYPLKQLLPFTYRTHYQQDGQPHFAVWRMWLGRVFDHEDMTIIRTRRVTHERGYLTQSQ